jgi:hypothetical protein
MKLYAPLALLVIAALLIGVFRVKDESAATAQTVHRLEAEAAAEQERRALLQAEKQYLESPARLERLAQQKEPAADPSMPDPQP